jgi:hypothetical protein
VNSTAIWGAMNNDPMFSILGFATIKALKVTERALKTTNHTLLLSIYLQQRRELTDSLTYFYYPLTQFLTGREDRKMTKEGVQQYIDYMFFDIGKHLYLGDPGVVAELNRLMDLDPSVKKIDFGPLRDRVDDIREKKAARVVELTMKIEELNSKWFREFKILENDSLEAIPEDQKNIGSN